MSLPLVVRLSTSRAERHITRDLRELRFRETAVGGWASATMALDRPLIVQPDEISYYGRCYVYDARSGATVWEGRLEDPGRGARVDGQIWELTAMGPAAHAQDRTVPLIYVDRDLGKWIDTETNFAADGRSNNATTDGTSQPVTPRIHMQWYNGAKLFPDAHVARAYPLLRASGQRLARFDYTWAAGRSDVNLRVQGVTRDTGGGVVTRDEAFNVAGGVSAAKVIATDFANTRDWLEVRIDWVPAAATVADDVTWADVIQPYVMATTYDKAGNQLLTGASYTAGTVLASDVVADLLGRLLTQYDGAGATIAVTSHPIDQLAYPDGVYPAKILADLMDVEPGYRWGAYESNAAGKHRFEWIAWPSSVRYEADVTDGFDSPASAGELYNAVRVRWRDAAGQAQLTRRTSSVAELTAAGLTREALIDLGDEVGSSVNAIRAGDQFLAEHATPPNAGRLTIARPVLDMFTGRMVMPWEIKAGELIRVRGVMPRVDALNASIRDGVTVFRVWAKEYSLASAAATLDLDSYSRATARALATLQTDQINRRRR